MNQKQQQQQQQHHHSGAVGGGGTASASSRRSRTGKEGRFLEKGMLLVSSNLFLIKDLPVFFFNANNFLCLLCFLLKWT